MNKLGRLKVEDNSFKVNIEFERLRQGVNDLQDHVIKVDSDNKIEYIINKVCDHAGGRLIIKAGEAICPMHNWKLNLESLEYNNSHICKKTIPYSTDSEGNVSFYSSKKSLLNPFSVNKRGKVKVRWINHASVIIECNGSSLMTDPWLFGPAFLTGWWLATPSPAESIELLKSVDYVYISHNHPDHLHAETLALVPKDKPIITANFQSASSEVMLQKLGFTNIYVPDFYEVFEICKGFQFSILKSGDFRDDSGIYISVNGYEFLLAVDANFLNGHVLPQGIDLLMTSFAGGASGFPLCYDNFTEEEKGRLIKRSRNSIKAKVINYVKTCKPKYFMPYAGMFAENAQRDTYIKERNYKIEISEYQSLLEPLGSQLLHPNSYSQLIFQNGVLEILDIETKEDLRREDYNFYISNLKAEYPYNALSIINYLNDSGYKGNQILQIIPTNSDFESVVGDIIYADFVQGDFRVIDSSELLVSHHERRVMQMRVRSEIIMCTIENYLPWEDLLIGFQMRANRSPNTYESDFWYYFTNVFVAKENFKYSSLCGSCTIVEQNPIWI